jgi:hypothetical protein
MQMFRRRSWLGMELTIQYLTGKRLRQVHKPVIEAVFVGCLHGYRILAATKCFWLPSRFLQTATTAGDRWRIRFGRMILGNGSPVLPSDRAPTQALGG